MDSLADALSRGATAEEVGELAQAGQRQGQRMSPDRLAACAKSLAVIKEAKIPSKDVAAVVTGVTIAVDLTTNQDVLLFCSIFSKTQFSTDVVYKACGQAGFPVLTC